MRILLNADDFGFSPDTVDATIDCLRSGAILGATIMPKMPATAAALDFARSRPDLSFGVHLTFGGDGIEAPLSPPADVRDMVGPDGRFLQSNRVRWRAVFGQIAPDQIDRELTAQLQFIFDAGIRPSHVDSHGHLHKFAPFRRALARALPRFGIARVRSAQDIYLRKPLRSPNYWIGPWWRRQLRKRFRTTDHFYMPASAWDRAWPDALIRDVLPRLPGATLEVGVHPGREEAWRADEAADVRRFALAAREAGHELIGWRDL